MFELSSSILKFFREIGLKSEIFQTVPWVSRAVKIRLAQRRSLALAVAILDSKILDSGNTETASGQRADARRNHRFQDN